VKIFFSFAGLGLIAAGLFSHVHPEIRMPAKREEVQIGPMKVPIETRRIIDVPPIAGGIVILAGGAVLFFGLRRN
jgi:hypothetical protein